MCIATDENTATKMKVERPPNPFAQASWRSRLFFTWPYPLLKLGMERTLKDEDQPDCLPQDTSAYSLQYFNRIWNIEKAQHPNNPSLSLRRDPGRLRRGATV